MISILDIASPTGTFRMRLKPGEMRLGRAPDSDIFVRDKLVSSRHASISLSSSGECRIRDLGSTNGIFVNGVRRSETVLRPGDTLRFGSTIAVYVEEPEGAEVGQSTLHAMEVVRAKPDETGFDLFSITVGVDEIAHDLAAAEGSPESGSAAMAVARTRLALLYRLAQGANVEADLDQLLTHIAQVVREGIGPERIAILVSDRDGAPAVRRFARDWRRPGEIQSIYVPRLMVATAMYERKALLFLDVLHDPRFRDEPRLAEAQIRQAMAAPILFGGKVRGAIYIDRANDHPLFTAEEVYLLGIVANQSGAILQNQELFARERHALDELRHTQEELIGATRLATIGELLGGIANEINNPIAAIVGFAELLATSERCPSEMREDLEHIRQSSLRLKRTLHQLLAFCRRAPDRDDSFSVERKLREVLELRRVELDRKGIGLELDFSRGIPPVAGEATQIQLVVLNLVQNAEEALLGRAGGRIVIRGRCDHERARITVEDNGPGIAPDALPRIFDPFFSTRPAGSGAGLGLSISLAIARAHGGKLEAANQPGKGAVLSLDLPLKRGASVEQDQTGAVTALPRDAVAAALKGRVLAPAIDPDVTGKIPAPTFPTLPPPPSPVAAPAGAASSAGAASGVVSGSNSSGSIPTIPPGPRARVLVCDDEDAVREVMGRALNKAGFEVLLTKTFEQAIGILEADGAGAAVLVTDIFLTGGRDGVELGKRALVLRPDLAGKIIYVSGDTSSPACRKLAAAGADMLTKPFELQELCSRVAARAAGRLAVTGE